jgi:putative CocE/NonD family hydrolase
VATPPVIEHSKMILTDTRPARDQGSDHTLRALNWACESRYVAVRDGTHLAVNVLRPTVGGDPVSERLPVIWAHNRYHWQATAPDHIRAWEEHAPWLEELPPNDGSATVSLEKMPWLEEVLKHGYVVGIVDSRGSGASFGTRSGPFSPEEVRDAYDITEWFASQPWCDGAVGMFGRSYMGTNQLFVAADPPPHLRAIFPEMALFDLYSFIFSGGVFRHDFARNWASDVLRRDTCDQAVHVDQDATGALLREARAEHRANRDASAMFACLPFRDSVDPQSSDRPYQSRNPAHDGSRPRKPKVPAYLVAGWYDPFVRDAFAWFNTIEGPKRLVVGPWAHTGSLGFDLAAEHLRWYDRWLKGADDPIAEEPPIYYYTMGAPEGKRWRAALKWPIPNAHPMRFYLSAGPSGSVRSFNDGALEIAPCRGGEATDDYRVDYSTTSGPASRWTNSYGGPFNYPDMTVNDEKAITYTTRPLEDDAEITGHPILCLWVTSTADDGDFFAYLEEVLADGSSSYATEGVLRASHRRVSAPPLGLAGLPYHRSFAEDVVALPDWPVRLVFDLHPISRVFKRGHRVRLSIACADRDNALALEAPSPPLVRIYRGGSRASYLILPAVANRR